MFPVHSQPTRIQLRCTRHHLKLDDHIVLHLYASTIGSTGKFLTDNQIFDKIQIDIFGNCHIEFLDKISGVERNIKIPDKTRRLGIERYERQFQTLFTVQHQGITQIILIKCRPQRRKRTHKPSKHEGYIVLKYIDFLEYLIVKSRDTFATEHLVDPLGINTFYFLAVRLRIFAIIIFRNFLPNRNGKNRLTCYLRSINKIKKELEFLKYPSFSLLFRKII